MPVAKRYDRAYFDRWYRDPRRRIEPPGDLRRRVTMAVAITERFLGRAIRTALDVGCGEGRWRAELRRLRPRAAYLGVEPSQYAVERFGSEAPTVLLLAVTIASGILQEGNDHG